MFGASIKNARENGVGSAGFDSDAFADIWQGAGERGEVKLLGLVLCELKEHDLQLGDLAADRCRVQRVAVGKQFGFLFRCEHVRDEQPAWGSLRRVVET